MRLDVTPSSTPEPWSSSSARVSFSSLCLKSLLVLSLTAPFGIARLSNSPRQPLSPTMLAIHQLAKRPTAKPAVTVDAATTSQTDSSFNSAQGPGPGPIGPGPGCDLFPAPPSVGASVPLSYFGPPPSTVNPSLVGPVQLLNSGTVDASNGTITLPLYKGTVKGSGKTVWYILTDVSDQGIANELGLNFSAKLGFAQNAARTGTIDDNGNIVFDKGTVDFSPQRNIVPGPAGQEFPPKSFAPGEIGDKNYSPFVTITNAGNVVYNAPMIAYNVDASEIDFPNGNVDYSKVHDAVAAIDTVNMTVTLNLVNGFSFGRPVWYISMDASIPLAAAIEHNTYAPLMASLLLGHDDSAFSPIERIFIATNGPEAGELQQPSAPGSFCRLSGWIQAEQHHSAVFPRSHWTTARRGMPTFTSGLRTLSTRDTGVSFARSFRYLTFVQDGLLTGPGGAPFGSAGFSINCPIVQRLD